MDENYITYFAETDSRNKRVPFGIRSKDRSRHMYVIGKTGMGKSTLLENMAIQDIQNGEGMAFIDPHGKTADLLLEYVPKERIKDVVYFAPFDTEYPISFNVMEDVGVNKRHLVANGLMSAFKKIWVDAWSARMEYILSNILLALLEYPDSTLVGVNRMLADKDYRKKVVDNIKDPSVKSFWVDEFAKYGDRYMQEAGAAIQNKIGQFISNPLVRNIIGQPKSSFDIRKVMDEKKILIINLSKGRVGETNANLLGSMIITKIYLGALSRADASETKLKGLPPFYLYVDEFQSFANESFADILSEARKYKLSLTIAHQYIEQMSEEVRAAVFGNVGTMITFRVGAFDAEVLEKEFAPVFTAEDLVNLGFVQTYMKLMIDGVTSQPFSATTLPPIKKPDITNRDDIIESSRSTFARPREEVEEAIRKWHEPVQSDRVERSDRSERKEPSSTTKSVSTAGSSAPAQTQAPRQSNSQPQPQLQPPSQQQPQPRPQIPSSASSSSPASSQAVRTPTSAPAVSPQPAPVTSAPSQANQTNQTNQMPKPVSKPQVPAPSQSNQSNLAEPKPIPLDSLKKSQNRGPSPQNLSQLKEALKDIVEKAKKEEPIKSSPVKAQLSQSQPLSQPTPTVTTTQTATQTIAQITAQTSAQPSPKAPTRDTVRAPMEKNRPAPAGHDVGPTEVSEDVLRRVLGMPKRK